MKENEHEINCLEIRTNSDKIKIKGDDLHKQNIYAYSIGHVLNDLTATCWFSFLLYYITDIVQLSPSQAGWVMLAGQIADGLATPLVGIFSDKFDTRFGRRTPWYFCGTIMVIVCFTLIWQKCTFCESLPNPKACELIYYILLPSLFNIGWASVQVSHMALLPGITLNKKNRDYMVRLRTAFTFISQLVCLSLSLLIFYYVQDKFLQYSVLTISCVVIGIIASIIFMIYCPETALNKNLTKYYEEMKDALIYKKDEDKNKTNNSISLKSNKMNSSSFMNKTNNLNYDSIEETRTIKSSEMNNEVIDFKYWLKKPIFYQNIIIYMLVRISINVTTSMLPYYIEQVLGFTKTKYGGTPIEISIVYIILTTGCVFNSLYLQKLFETFGSRLHMMFASFLFVTAGCLPLLFLDKKLNYPIYFVSFIFGIGFSLGLSNASSLTNDVVGGKGANGAFVYGAYSFADKLSCGIILFIFVDNVKENQLLISTIVPILPVITTFLCLLMLMINFFKKKEQSNNKKQDLEISKSIIDSSQFSFISVK